MKPSPDQPTQSDPSAQRLESGAGRQARSARAAGAVSVAVMISRILGLAREMTFARLFGAGMANDAFLVAMRIPNMFRDLFAEGALSSAFVPTFTDYLRNKGAAQAWTLANLVLSALLVILGAFALILFAFPDQALFLVASGYSDEAAKAELATQLIRTLSPFLLFIALAASAMGMLNTVGRFFLPALAPAIFNLTLVLTGFLVVPYWESRGGSGILIMGVAALLGGFLQFAVQWPLLRRYGFRFRFRIDFSHPGIRRILRLLAPAVVGIGAVQINILVTTQMATYLSPEDGPVSWLSYAFRILYLPVGMVGVAVGSVNLRNVSISAAAQDWDAFRSTVADSLKLVSLLSLPAAVGMLMLAHPIVRALFERGRFGPADTRFTAAAVMCYSLALLAYSAQKVFVPSFYALNDTRTPVRISLAAVALNLIFNATVVFGILNRWVPEYAYLGLAAGTTAALLLQVLLLQRAYRRRMGSLEQVGSTLLKMGLAATAMAAALGLMRAAFEGIEALEGLQGGARGAALALSIYIPVGAAVYFALCHLLGVHEVRIVLSSLLGRFRKKTDERRTR